MVQSFLVLQVGLQILFQIIDSLQLCCRLHDLEAALGGVRQESFDVLGWNVRSAKDDGGVNGNRNHLSCGLTE